MCHADMSEYTWIDQHSWDFASENKLIEHAQLTEQRHLEMINQCLLLYTVILHLRNVCSLSETSAKFITEIANLKTLSSQCD